MRKYPEEANPYTHKLPADVEEESVFLIPDSLTSRAAIKDLSDKFKDEVVAIIGLGGTGSYILDLIARTPVKEIRTFDFDEYVAHNAFRSPGRTDKTELGKSKSFICKERYKGFRKNIIAYDKAFDDSCRQDIDGVTFAFVCVDKGTARSNIITILSNLGIPFIDTGIDIKRTETGELRGMTRTTYFSTDPAQISKSKSQVPLTDPPDDMYKTNIQIGEINNMNACLAVLRYKQLKGFYHSATQGTINNNLLFEITDIRIFGDESDD
jgi:hypothetical protein